MENATLSAVPGDSLGWDTSRRLLRVQVFGAGRAVGRELVRELLRSGHPAGGLALFGRRPKIFAWQGATLPVQPIGGGLPEADVAFVCTTPDLARQLVPILIGRGTRVVDLSGAHRNDPAIPLVLDSINGGEVGAFTEMFVLPNRAVALIAPLLWVLEQAAGLEEVDCFALLSVASEGARGILALREELAGAAGNRDPRERRVGNLLPVGGGSDNPDAAMVEAMLAEEVRRLLGRSDLAFDVIAVEGDVERCDAFAVKVHLRAALGPDEAAALFAGVREIQVDPGPVGTNAATPLP